MKYILKCSFDVEKLNVGYTNLMEKYCACIEWGNGKYFVCVGKKDNGRLVSYVPCDRETKSNTGLKKLLATENVVSKPILWAGEIHNDDATYYIIYDVTNHSSKMPNFTEYPVPCDGNDVYYLTYEFVFAFNDLTRTIVWEFVNKAKYLDNLYSLVTDFPDIFSDNFDRCGKDIDGIWYDDFEESIMVLFYDKFGKERDLDFESSEELLKYLVSARLIDIKKKEQRV